VVEIEEQQKESPACDRLLRILQFYSRHFGKTDNIDILEEALPVYGKTLGFSMFERALGDIEIELGFSQMRPSEVDSSAMPFIFENSDGYMVAVDRLKDGRIDVFDPCTGTTSPLEPTIIDGTSTGRVYFVRESRYEEQVKQERLGIPKPKSWFYGTLKLNKKLYTQVLIASVVINVFVLTIPMFTMNVYDRIIPNNAVDSLQVLTIGVTLILLFDLIFKLLRSHFIEMAGRRVNVILYSNIFEHVLNLKMDAKPKSTGNFIKNLNAFESVREFFTTSTIALAVDLPFVLLFLVVMFSLGGVLAFVSLFFAVGMLVFAWFMQKPISKVVEQSHEEESIKHGMLVETVFGLETVKSSRGQKRMRTMWEKSIEKTTYFHEKSQFLTHIVTYVGNMVTQISTVVIVFVGVYLAKEGDATLGTIFAVSILNGRVMAPVMQISGLLMRFDRTMLALKGVESVMQLPLERDRSRNYIVRNRLKGDIELQNVSFAFSEEESNVLQGINFSVREGEKVAIIGRIGSGKSTLIKLINRLHEASEGKVYIDGADVKQLDTALLRSQIGFVPQEPMLFSGTLLENICLADLRVDEEMLAKSVIISGVEEFAKAHANGYDMRIEEAGANLSGGERQAVTIARALVHDPDVLIFDEPTSAMDNHTERRFKERLKSMIEDKTMILVTHKTSMLDLVDRIVVMDRGKIIADGPRDEIFMQLTGPGIQAQSTRNKEESNG
jgi:ATP-binding cassette subfamily C protein LapB